MEWNRVTEIKKNIEQKKEEIEKGKIAFVEEIEILEEELYVMQMELQEKENYQYFSDNEIDW